MSQIYTHELTPIEIECGVTLDQVAAILPQVLMIEHGKMVVIPADISPALASSVARVAFGGREYEFSHLAVGNMPVYKLAE